MAISTIPSTFGNPGPGCRTVITVPPGPRRLTDGGEHPPFHVAAARGVSRPRPRRPIRLHACRKILVVKLDFIGDWILTTPFLENLRRSAPRAEITVVVLDRVFAVARACPFVDRVVSLSAAIGRRTWFAADGPATLGAFRRDYLGGAFDLALVPRWDIDFNGALQVAHGSGAPRIVDFTERATARKRVLNRGEDRFVTDLLRDDRVVHEVEHNLHLLEAIGGTVDRRRVTIHVPPRDVAAARTFQADAFGVGGRPFLAVAPFVEHPRRQYPSERLAAIVRHLQADFDLDVAVVGGPSHAEAAAALAASLGERAVPAAGHLSVLQSAALIARAQLFIGMDGGPAHVAAAVGTPVVVLSCHPLHGSAEHVHSPIRFAPWADPARVLVLQPDAPRPPCADGCDADEPHCILGLSEARVLSEVSDLLATVSAGQASPAREREPA